MDREKIRGALLVQLWAIEHAGSPSVEPMAVRERLLRGALAELDAEPQPTPSEFKFTEDDWRTVAEHDSDVPAGAPAEAALQERVAQLEDHIANMDRRRREQEEQFAARLRNETLRRIAAEDELDTLKALRRP